MQAAVYEAFRGPVRVQEVPDPTPEVDGVVLEVAATGVCRSDWHGWMGHDADIRLPHVPGHEISGVVVATGAAVERFVCGDRVTLPFVCGCGSCADCRTDAAHVCPHQTQPGFTHWGSYAQYVAVRHADYNLVALPDALEHSAAATLGCRFATAFRAVVFQGGFAEEAANGRWLAVHGCGGVGLSAVMIGRAFGARVIAVDVDEAALALARSVGAEVTIDARKCAAVAERVRDGTDGGAHVSIDALGSRETLANSVAGLRRRGRHVQVGLLAGEDSEPSLSMSRLIGRELEIVGSHGMQASRYPDMLELIAAGKLQPERLVTQTVKLEQAARDLTQSVPTAAPGITVIDMTSP